MKIGILTHNFPTSLEDRQDAGVFLYDFANALSKKARVYVLCPDIEGEKDKYPNLSVKWFKWGRTGNKFGSWSLFNPLSLLKFLKLIILGTKETNKFVNDNKIDFLLAAWAVPAGIFAWQNKLKFKTPYATWSLGSDINQYSKIPILKQLIKSALKNADIRFANSFAVCNKVTKLVGKDCLFLPAITEFEVKTKKSMKLDQKRFHFLFVGRLEKVKGIDILIQAINKLKSEVSDFTLHIIGPGSLTESVKSEVKALGLSDQVEFLGKRGAEDIKKYMLSTDCLVISSRHESLPLVLLEAARCGLPIITSDVGDCAKLINQYNLGMVVKKEDSADLSKKMKSAIEQGTLFKEVYQKGLREMADNFVQEKAVDELLKNIQKVI